jgi:type VI secretion system protein ImpJ
MHLGQHHFQLQSRFHLDVADFIISSLSPHASGLIDCQFDNDALRNGVVSILHARGVMPDGLVFRFPEDPPPPSLQLHDEFSPTAHSHLLFLAIPAFENGRANLSAEDVGATSTRFRPTEEQFADETTGADSKPVQLATKNFRLLLDRETDEGLVTLPIARLTRDGAGNFRHDPEFIPPCIRIGASTRIMTELQRLLDMLESKAAALSGERALGGAGDEADELVSFWLSHTVQSAIPPLKHHLRNGRSHPEHVFVELARLAGALCTFSLDGSAAELPLYEHADLETCFSEVHHHLRRNLDVVVAQTGYTIRLTQTSPNFYAGEVGDDRAFDRGAWYLAVHSASGREKLAKEVPRLVKVCSAKHIERLVREAFPGLTLQPVATPPSGLKPRPGVSYFSMERTDPCWTSMSRSKSVGLYVPDSIEHTGVTVHVLDMQ